MADEEHQEEQEQEETQETEESSEQKTDWKAMARKWEREAKKRGKSLQETEARIKEREDADQSEHEKAVSAARDEGEKTARQTAEKERRTDRLENATLKLAGKGIRVRDGEETKTLKFADPDDAVTHIERLIRRGDLDEDEIFDDKGKVNNEALTTALEELLASKPHLSASSPVGSSRRVTGSADAGKGAGSGKAIEDLSVEEHLARLQNRAA